MTHSKGDTALISLATGLIVPSLTGDGNMGSAAVVRHMAAAAEAFLASLTASQRGKAAFAFEDRERFDWHYIPRNRAGLSFKEMRDDQRRLARLLLEAGLSDRGYWKATTIMALEEVLGAIEPRGSLDRDPGKYDVSIFGKPSEHGTWGWRVEGHHLSLNITVVNGRLLADAPRFLGAHPTEVVHGDLAGTRVLQKEEDLARRLVRSLDGGQRARAVFRKRAFKDIVTGNSAAVDPMKPEGIRAADLTDRQAEMFFDLIEVYASTMADDIARRRMKDVHDAGTERLYFGWAGSLAPGEPHYYRIQAPDAIIEYDNVQNDANHIHTVWRDFESDFGRDLLREHYRKAHGDGS